MRLIWRFTAFALGLLSCLVSPARAQTEPVAPPSAPPPGHVVEWVRDNSIVVGSADGAPDATLGAAISQIVGDARVIAFGESGHGNREPLQYRNWLIRHLVEKEGLTAVALESGIAESKALYDYVLGAPGDPAELTRVGLTHGFGFIAENRELIEWLQQHNRANPGRKVRFYGIDRSTIQSGPPGAKGYGVILERIGSYLAETIPDRSRSERLALKGFERRFTEVDYRSWTDADRRKAQRMVNAVERLFTAHRTRMIRKTSRDEYEWAKRLAYDAQQLIPLFAAWTDDPFQYERLIRLIELRDTAMAEHTLWALQREGPNGKILLFQTNGHISADTFVGSVMRSFPRQPALTGIVLRKALGDRYRPIATISSRERPATDSSLGSIDRAFAAAGRSPALLNLHAPGRPDWWSRLQSASQGDRRVDDFVPIRAFDAMLYIDRFTPLPPPPRP